MAYQEKVHVKSQFGGRLKSSGEKFELPLHWLSQPATFTVIVAGLPCRRLPERSLLALPGRDSPYLVEALRYAPRAGRVMGVAVERACQDRAGQQGVAEPSRGVTLGAEVTWKKSSWSAHNGNCVEVAALSASSFGVRDSKDTNSPILIFDQRAWCQFLADLRTGGLNLPE